MALRIRQYAHFDVRSRRLTSEEMATRIGSPPDEWLVMGVRRSGPRPVPWAHVWSLRCEETGPGFGAGDQVRRLVDRLLPYEQALVSLVDDLSASEGADVGAVMCIARFLKDPQGGIDGGQHHLIGMHFDAEVVRFLAAVGASIDVDEYGPDFAWWRLRAKRRSARGYFADNARDLFTRDARTPTASV